MEELDVLIKEITDKNILVIVEGKKDKKALEELGIKKIMLLGAEYKTIEEAANEKEVILLVDLDKEGKSIYHRLKKGLNERGVKVNDKLREFLFKNTKLRQIEGLSNYLRRNYETQIQRMV